MFGFGAERSGQLYTRIEDQIYRAAARDRGAGRVSRQRSLDLTDCNRSPFAPTQLGDLKIGSDTGTCFKVGVQRRPVAGADCEQR